MEKDYSLTKPIHLPPNHRFGRSLPGKRIKMKVNLQNMGWKSKVTQKRATLSISINKLVAIGCCLEKGQTLYSYLAEDDHKRPIMIIYLDGKERDKK